MKKLFEINCNYYISTCVDLYTTHPSQPKVVTALSKVIVKFLEHENAERALELLKAVDQANFSYQEKDAIKRAVKEVKSKLEKKELYENAFELCLRFSKTKTFESEDFSYVDTVKKLLAVGEKEVGREILCELLNKWPSNNAYKRQLQD